MYTRPEAQRKKRLSKTDEEYAQGYGNIILDQDGKPHASPSLSGLDQINSMLNTHDYVAFRLPMDRHFTALIEGPKGFVLGHYENDKHNNFLCEFVPLNQSVLKWEQFFSIQKKPYVGSLEGFYSHELAEITSRLPKDQLRDVHIENMQIGDKGQDAIAFIIDLPSKMPLKRDLYVVKAVRISNYLLIMKYSTHYYNEHQQGYVRVNQLPWRLRAIDAINGIQIAH